MCNKACVRNDPTEVVSDLPPSAKLVFKSLQYRGELTQKELIEETRLNPRTVRDGIRKLEENDIVTSQINFQDARQQVYSIASPFQTDDTDGGRR